MGDKRYRKSGEKYNLNRKMKNKKAIEVIRK